MAPSSFAQVSISLFPDISSGEVQTNRNAQTATPGTVGAGLLVTGSVLANSPLTTTRLRIVYPGPITSQPAATAGNPNNCVDGDGAFIPCPFRSPDEGGTAGRPAGDPLRIEGATGVFAGVTALRLNTASSRIEMDLPSSACAAGDCAVPATNTNSGSFRIVGVRIDANGKTGAQTISASLNTSANNYLLTTTSATVINNLGAGIGSVAIGTVSGSSNSSAKSATIFTNRNVSGTLATLLITEGFASAWRSNGAGGAGTCASGTPCQAGNNTTPVKNGTRIRLTFNNVPAGVTLSLGTQIGTGAANTAAPLAPVLSNTTITASATTTELYFAKTSTTSTESVELDINIPQSNVSNTAAVTTPGVITVTATLVPIGDGVGSVGLPREDQGYPTFVEADIGPVTVVNIVAANTTMLVSFAYVAGAFDTGIAVANTTADPFGVGAGGATKSSGTITIDAFPTTLTGGAGPPWSVTTSSTVKPGAGLSSDGTLAAGATWTVLLSQLITAAGQTGSFSGYIFIRANFLDAHGTATVTDFKSYSLATNVLVLPPPATSSRDAPGSGAEALEN